MIPTGRQLPALLGSGPFSAENETLNTSDKRNIQPTHSLGAASPQQHLCAFCAGQNDAEVLPLCAYRLIGYVWREPNTGILLQDPDYGATRFHNGKVLFEFWLDISSLSFRLVEFQRIVAEPKGVGGKK